MRVKRLEQKGFASIIIVMTLVVILGLIVLGFSRLMRNEQRSALDRQLSTQAYYAAESGVHDAMYALQHGFTTTSSTTNTCLTPSDLGPSFSANSNVLDSNSNTQYTCLMIDSEPTTIEYNPVSVTKGSDQGTKYAPLIGFAMNRSAEQTIQSLKFSWAATQGGSTFASSSCVSNCFPPGGGWKYNPGVIQVSLTPFAGNFDRTGLINNTFVAFLYPSKGPAGSTGFTSYIAGNPSQQGPIVSGSCNTGNAPRQCNVLVKGLASSRYFVSIRSFYANSDVLITPYSDANGNSPMRINGAQALVDSTGKSQDVLRRIQVRVPGVAQNFFPEGALDAGGQICKELEVAPAPAPISDGYCDLTP